MFNLVYMQTDGELVFMHNFIYFMHLSHEQHLVRVGVSMEIALAPIHARVIWDGQESHVILVFHLLLVYCDLLSSN